jgi:two-component system response regulator DevR
MDDSRITLFVVDADELARTGLQYAVAGEDDLEIVGEATSIAEATARLPLARPDVVLVDLDLPDGCGTDVARFTRSRVNGSRVAILSTNGDDAAVAHAVRAGAHAYITKRILVPDLLESIRKLADGRPLTDRRHRARIDELAGAADADERLARLTHQERVLLELLAEGLTNREIAERMGLSDKTVKNYVSSVMMKLEVTHRAAAAAYFARAEAQLPCSAQADPVGDGVIRY